MSSRIDCGHIHGQLSVQSRDRTLVVHTPASFIVHPLRKFMYLRATDPRSAELYQ